MKTKINNYSFDKTAKTVTFTDYTTIRLDSMLLIVNATDNIIIFNFADPAKGGTVTNNVLTLSHDTSSMDNTDKLLIYYDDITEEQLVLDSALLTELQKKADQTEEQLIDLDTVLKVLLQAVSYPPSIDRSTNKIRVDATGTAVTATFASNQDIRNITGGLTMLDIYYARQEVMAMNNMAWRQCVRQLIS